MANYSRQIRTAQRMIKEKGMTMVFVKIITQKDPETGKMVKTRTESSFYGVKVEPTAEEIAAGMFPVSAVVVLAAGGTIPAATTVDELQFNGRRWQIKNVHTVAPAEQDILYKLEVRDIGNI